MKDDYNYIDELVKDSLEDFREEAGTEVWEKLRWTLFWMKYRWYIGLSSVLLLLGVSAFVTWQLPVHTDIQVVQTNLTEPNNQLLLAYNQEVENHAMYEEALTSETNVLESANDMSTTQPTQTENAIAASATTAPNFTISREMTNSSDQMYSDRMYLILSGLSALPFSASLTTNPDTNLIGYNRRTDLPVQPVKKQWLSMNLYGGPSFVNSGLSGVNSEYLNIRNDNESNAMGWSVGSDIRFHFKNWVFTTGISYAQYNQNRRYIHQYQEYSPGDSYFDYDTTWVYIFDPPNYGVPMISKIDSTWVKVYHDVTIDQSGKNRVSYFEIPLMVGYTMHHNRFSMELNAGASVGFLTYSNVWVPDESNSLQLLKVNEMQTTMYNVVANASLYYHLDRRTSLFVSPYYKQNMRSIFNNNFPQTQHFNTIGINFGVNILF